MFEEFLKLAEVHFQASRTNCLFVTKRQHVTHLDGTVLEFRNPNSTSHVTKCGSAHL